MALSVKRMRSLRRRRKRRLFLSRCLPVIPFLFTFSNACFGMWAAMHAIDDAWLVACYYIIAAALMDSCDGRIARWCNATSLMGAELDTLCDAISFCVAPTVLLYSFCGDTLGVIGKIALGMYVCAGLFRLARFTVHHTEHDFYFVGLPTPVAALFLTLLVRHHQRLADTPLWWLISPVGWIGSIIVLSFLMVSRILYPSFKQYRPRFPYSLMIIVPVLIVTVVCWQQRYPIFLALCGSYISAGLVYCWLSSAKRSLISIFCRNRAS